MDYFIPTTVKYSEAFKMTVVKEIEKGRLNKSQAMEKYGIRGSETITRWLKKFGKNHLLGKVVRIEMEDELSEIKRLKKEKKELESALAQTQMEVLALESLVEIAKDDYGIDLKKKIGEKEFNLRRKRQKKRK